MHDPRVGRFFAVDPLLLEFPWYSPYHFTGNSPLLAIELEGLESSETPNQNETNTDDVPLLISIGGDKMIKDYKAHKIVYEKSKYLAFRAAYPGRGSIRHEAVVFSCSGESIKAESSILEKNGPVESDPDRGSERGAFRHALWSAQMTIEFGIDDAKLVSDTHEVGSDRMKEGFSGIDVSKTTNLTSIYEADRIADELNNIVGRNYALKNGGTNFTKETAIGILKEFKENGLYVVKQSEDMSFKVVKEKLSKEKYDKLIKRWETLDNYGNNKVESYQTTRIICFSGKTKVYTKNYGEKEIKNIRSGDFVLSYNFKSNKNEYKRVLSTKKSYTNKLTKIYFKDDFVICTTEHPFFLESIGWVPASKLKAGYYVHSANSKIKVLKIENIKTEKQAVYNLQIESNKNYFVSSNKVLVHNDSYIPYENEKNEKNEK